MPGNDILFGKPLLTLHLTRNKHQHFHHSSPTLTHAPLLHICTDTPHTHAALGHTCTDTPPNTCSPRPHPHMQTHLPACSDTGMLDLPVDPDEEAFPVVAVRPSEDCFACSERRWGCSASGNSSVTERLKALSDALLPSSILTSGGLESKSEIERLKKAP